MTYFANDLPSYDSLMGQPLGFSAGSSSTSSSENHKHASRAESNWISCLGYATSPSSLADPTYVGGMATSAWGSISVQGRASHRDPSGGYKDLSDGSVRTIVVPPAPIPTTATAITTASSSSSLVDMAITIARPSAPPPPPPPLPQSLPTSPPPSSDPPERERKHACEMCHKKFDRPSTLKKHLLVHTGEKAFQCETCGRRFGVASNLNRHARKCVLKPVNNKSVASGASASSISPSPPPISAAAQASASASTSVAAPASRAATSPMTTVKRRRRAPPPTHWIPESLKGFNLATSSPYFQSKCPVPLPPVRPSYDELEERDSWDMTLGMLMRPYHPEQFVKLPGPGTGSDTGTSSMGWGWNSRGHGGSDGWGGRVLVF